MRSSLYAYHVSRTGVSDVGDLNATPALAGRQLFLRSHHHLYCLALPGGLRAAR